MVVPQSMSLLLFVGTFFFFTCASESTHSSLVIIYVVLFIFFLHLYFGKPVCHRQVCLSSPKGVLQAILSHVDIHFTENVLDRRVRPAHVLIITAIIKFLRESDSYIDRVLYGIDFGYHFFRLLRMQRLLPNANSANECASIN